MLEEKKGTADEDSEKNTNAFNDKNAGNVFTEMPEGDDENSDVLSADSPELLSQSKYDNLLDENDPEDALLIKALRQYDDELLDQFLNGRLDERPFAWSKRGRRNIRDLFSQRVGPERAALMLKRSDDNYKDDLRQWRERRRKRVAASARKWGIGAAAAIIAVIISVVNTENSLAFKLPDVGFLEVVRDDYTQIFWGSSQHSFDSDVIETSYVLGEVVEGYVLVDSIITQRLNYYIYENLSGDQYFFSQQYDVANVAVNTEIQVLDVIDTLYGEAQYYTNGSVAGLAWSYNNYSFKIEGNLDVEELIILQNSLQKS